MELQQILPDLVKEVIKQTLESIMIAEREVFLKENGGTKTVSMSETLIFKEAL